MGSNPVQITNVVFSLIDKAPLCEWGTRAKRRVRPRKSKERRFDEGLGSNPGDNRKDQLAYSLMEEHCATNITEQSESYE